jgi:Leucine-rich repeat (LRR) protein
MNSIGNDTFKQLNNLQSLDISNNNLTMIDQILNSNLKKLTQLNLNGNRIETIGTLNDRNRSFFDNFEYIQTLYLSDNNIKMINLQTFSNLSPKVFQYRSKSVYIYNNPVTNDSQMMMKLKNKCKCSVIF